MRPLLAGGALALASMLAAVRAADAPHPLHALMITGGCCHDYAAQKKILSAGISARANVAWTIVHEGDDREHRVSLYDNPDWARGCDVVLHNECYGYVDDAAFVERIAAVHKNGVPAVMLHCSSHSYRIAPTDEWRQVLGIKSTSHEKRRDLVVKRVAGVTHPVMIGFPESWADAEDECYKNEQIRPGVIALATAYGEETKKDHVVVWVNTHGKGRTFATTLGHTNETMQSAVYLDLVTRGLLWACGKLGDDGNPLPGYGPSGK